MAALLAVVLATTPVMQVTAASPVSGGAVFQNLSSQDDINVVISAAGIPSGTLATSLQYAFNVSVTNYRHSTTNKTAAAISTLFSNYVSAAQAGSQSGATVAAVNTAMQNLMTLMGAIIPDYNDQEVITVLKGLILPLTKSPLSQSAAPAGVGDDQYLVNIFVNELAAWVPIQQNASGNQNNNANNAMLLAAAQQLGLIPATAASMQNLINVAGCNTQPTIQKQINCAISFYNNWVNNTNQLIGQVANVTTNLNQLVATATTTITGYVTSYTSQINAATSTVDVTSAFNAGLAAINAVYPPLIGANGTIEAQNNLATNAENSLKTAVAQIGNVQSTQINATMASLTKAENDFTTAIGQADQAFPQQLPASGLTAATAVNFVTSVPGDAINTLNNAQGAITQPVQTVTANTTALTSALNTISSAMSTDQTNGVNTINASTTIADAQTALNNGVTQVNTDYANLTSANSAYLVALNAAKSTQADLTALQASHAQVADVGTALTTITNAINNANAAAPILPSGTVFTATNAASTYQNTYAGQAIMGMLKAQGNTTQKLTPSNGGGLTSAQIGGIIGGILGFLAVCGAIYGLKKWLESQGGEDAINEMAENVANNGDTSGNGEGLTEEDIAVFNNVESEDLRATLGEIPNDMIAGKVDISDGTGLDIFDFSKLSPANLADLAAGSHANMDNLMANNSELFTKVQALTMKTLSKSMATVNNTDVPFTHDQQFSDLVNETFANGSSYTDWAKALGTVDTQLRALQDQGFTPDDMLTMASNPQYFPEGTDMSKLGENLSELTKVIENNSIQKPADLNDQSFSDSILEKITGARAGITKAADEKAFEQLVDEQEGSDISDKIIAANELIEKAIPKNSSFSADDIIDLISNPDNLPSSVKTMTDAVNLVGKTLAANPNIDINDPVAFDTAAAKIANIPVISGDGPIGIDGAPLSVGGTGQNVPGAEAFNKLAAQGEITAAGVRAMLDDGMSLRDLTTELDAIKTTLEKVIDADGAYSEAAKKLKEQIDAGNEAGEAKAAADGNSDGFDPVTVDV